MKFHFDCEDEFLPLCFGAVTFPAGHKKREQYSETSKGNNA